MTSLSYDLSFTTHRLAHNAGTYFELLRPTLRYELLARPSSQFQVFQKSGSPHNRTKAKTGHGLVKYLIKVRQNRLQVGALPETRLYSQIGGWRRLGDGRSSGFDRNPLAQGVRKDQPL